MKNLSKAHRKLVPCTPPLLPEEKLNFTREDNATKFGGTSCEHWVFAYFLLNQINIAEPMVDNGVDCLIEKEDEGWKRGQIKKVVYQEGIDYGYKDRHGVEVRRSRFTFALQGGGGEGIETTQQIALANMQEACNNAIEILANILTEFS